MARLGNALADAQRTYVRLSTADPDGVGVSRAESYRALHAVYHPSNFPHQVISPEVPMDSVEVGRAPKRAAAGGVEGEEAPAAKKPKAVSCDDDAEMETEEDWKATMFYWRGALSFDAGAETLSWSGAWVGSAQGLPTDQEFASSPNSFALTAQKVQGPLVLSAAAAGLEPAAGVEGNFTGSYLLDQGAGLEQFSDKTHSFRICGCSDGSVLVAARGTTEFGAFVSAGRLESGGSMGLQMTLARRYVDDADPRRKWTTAARVATELVSDQQGASADAGPWCAAAMRLKLS